PGGCAIPGVMATRTMRSEKERMATMLTAPLFVCGAKTPVFLMLTAAFFEESQAAVMMAMVAAGWIVSLLVAFILRRTVIRGASTPFVMELPPYRLPTMFSVLAHTWERSWMYMKKAGTVILAISVVLWAALTFPELDGKTEASYMERIGSIEQQLSSVSERTASLANDLGIEPSAQDGDSRSPAFAAMAEALGERLKPLEKEAAEIERLIASGDGPAGAALMKRLEDTRSGIAGLKAEKTLRELQERKSDLEERKKDVENALAYDRLGSTFGGRLGRMVEPFFRPLGFDWRTDVALIAGVAAKEAILSTMGTAYSIGEADPDDPDTLGSRLVSDPGWSKTVALALMLFTLIYSPCFVTLVVLKNEAGGWRWLFFSIIFNTAVAYAAAYAGTLIGRAIWGA
ncbi:MAG: hypothetical protein MJ061_03655, partial [Mailhella sp.]|nr:hypothetical protein [Mailhella sp.]